MFFKAVSQLVPYVLNNAVSKYSFDLNLLCYCTKYVIWPFVCLNSVESLVTVPVKDYADIDSRIEEGTRNRTVAATNMNATSR